MSTIPCAINCDDGVSSSNAIDATAAYVRSLVSGSDCERRARAEAAAGLSHAHISTGAVVTWYEDGRLVCLNRPTGRHEKRKVQFDIDEDNLPLGERSENYHVRYHIRKRGVIEQFSGDARRRMMQKVAMIPHRRLKELPVFVTLTYPGEWVEDGRIWKEDLNRFAVRFKRAWGAVTVIWKLEFQKRGAPHFHLLVYFSDATGHTAKFRKWLSDTWYECVRSGDPKHLAAGTRCEPVRSLNGVQFYCSKYMAKLVSERRNVGRFWGVWNWSALDVRPRSLPLTEHEFYRVRRVLFKHLKKLRPRMKGMNKYAGVWMFLSDDEAIRLVAWGIGPDG